MIYDKCMDRKLVSIREAAKFLGVTPTTLRRWEREGRLMPDERTQGGNRRYDLVRLGSKSQNSVNSTRKTVVYTRVSRSDQREELERQKHLLELYCVSQGWTFELVADVGSGVNYHNKGLQRLLEDIVADRVGRLVVTHQDRLLRFGADLIFALCNAKQVEVVILNQGEDSTLDDQWPQEALEIISMVSLRPDGTRSRNSQKMLDGVKQVLKNASS